MADIATQLRQAKRLIWIAGVLTIISLVVTFINLWLMSHVEKIQ